MNNKYCDQRMSRRQWLGACALPWVAAALSGCDGLGDKPVSIAAHTWLGYEPLFLAQRQGWLDSAQAQLIQTAHSGESIQALREGKVQAAALTLDEMVLARASGLALMAVLVFNVSAGADMLLVRPQITALSQLKGKRIGLEDSNLASVMVSAVLEQAGLRNTDVTLVRLSNDLHAKAWQQKSVDALITYEPVASAIQVMGAQKLFDSRQIPNVIVDVLAVHQEALDRSYKTAIAHAVNAHFRGLNHLQRSPQDAAYRMSEHLKLPAAEVLSAFKGLLLPDVVAGYHLLGGTAPALLDSARKLSALMVRGGQLAKADSLDKLLTNQYLPSDI